MNAHGTDCRSSRHFVLSGLMLAGVALLAVVGLTLGPVLPALHNHPIDGHHHEACAACHFLLDAAAGFCLPLLIALALCRARTVAASRCSNAAHSRPGVSHPLASRGPPAQHPIYS